jgi:hypothetical protein
MADLDVANAGEQVTFSKGRCWRTIGSGISLNVA